MNAFDTMRDTIAELQRILDAQIDATDTTSDKLSDMVDLDNTLQDAWNLADSLSANPIHKEDE